MADFYTNVQVCGDNILYIGYRNGKKIQSKVPYSPSLFIPSNKESKYFTLKGEFLQKVKPGSIKKCKEYIEKYKEIDNFSIYGNERFQYCFISDMFKNEVEWDLESIKIAIFDIEVSSDPNTGGFAKPEDAFQPITSIALKFFGKDKIYVWGYGEFEEPENVEYYKCKDEYSLCKSFLNFWEFEKPDVMSGWNIEGFDIPYIVNRFRKILGEQETKKLSPWGVIREKKNRITLGKNYSREEITYSFLGVSTLDYLILYKKYQPGGNSQESYKLDNIAYVEIGENKLEYDGSLHSLYINNYQKFLEYNIQDVNLIELLDNKCKLFSLALILSYDSKTNYEDIFTQTRMWDAMIYDFLKKKGVQVPISKIGEDTGYEGAFVKEPIAGLHKWIITLDATSLYPSIIMGKNIGPDTLVQPESYNQDLKNIISSGVNVESLLNKNLDLSCLKTHNVTVTPNAQFFRTDKKGFLTEMVEKVFIVRQKYKKAKIQAEKEYEVVCHELKKRGL